jgi:hypothetical protein
MITLQRRDLNAIVDNTLHVVTIFKSNRIKAYCGAAANWNQLKIATNATGAFVEQPIAVSPLVGNGCQDKSSCNLHGTCDFCYNTCTCDVGYGNPSEIFDYVQISCAERTCPAGRSLADLPTHSNAGHGMAECSNNGICSRDLGFCQVSRSERRAKRAASAKRPTPSTDDR